MVKGTQKGPISGNYPSVGCLAGSPTRRLRFRVLLASHAGTSICSQYGGKSVQIVVLTWPCPARLPSGISYLDKT